MSENPYKDKFDINKDRVWYARAVFGEEEKQAVIRCMDEFQLSPGKYTYEFEKQVGKLFDKEHAVMVNSGSSALLAVAELLDISPGDEIITAGSGFPTTINPFLLKGAKVVLVDINPRTASPILDQVEAAITPKTKAIVVAHIWGALNDMKSLRAIANRNNIILVEDSCDSIGQTIDGEPSGVYSDISVTSFFPSHVITAAGGGGMVMVRTPEEEKKLRVIRDWGRTGTDSEDLEDRFNVDLDGIPYDAKFFYGLQGYNLKATEIQAAFGLEQLKKLDKWNTTRQNNYNALREALGGLGITFIDPAAPNSKPSWLAFPFMVTKGDRIDLAKHLESNGVQTRPVLAGNFTRHPAFRNANIQVPFPLEGCDKLTACGLGVGLHQAITQKDIDHIEDTIRSYYK